MAEGRAGQLATGADVDLHIPRQRPRRLGRGQRDVVAAISLGGGVGGLIRYGIGYVFPAGATGFPWATFAVNVVGCLLIGVLMVLVSEVWGSHRLVRPFLGVGVLGGFTTFSTYVVDIQRLVDARATGTALLYLVATVLAALVAVYIGITLTRLGVRAHGRRERS